MKLPACFSFLSDFRLRQAAVAALLAAALWAPLWSTRMESPQYRGEEALQVRVYAGHIAGDIREIETLNQYIGVRLPGEVPELRLALWALGALLALAVAALLLPSAGRPIAWLSLVLMLALLLGGGALLQHRLYQLGHQRQESPFARVADFTPPILGSARIANFEVHAQLQWGAWAYLGALLLTAGTAFGGTRRGGVCCHRSA